MLSSRKWILSTAIAAAIAAMPGASLRAQAPATICKDGTTSVSSGRGACSGHGGIDKKAVSHQKRVVKSETKAAKAVTKRTSGTQVTTICADGTTSNSTGPGDVFRTRWRAWGGGDVQDDRRTDSRPSNCSDTARFHSDASSLGQGKHPREREFGGCRFGSCRRQQSGGSDRQMQGWALLPRRAQTWRLRSSRRSSKLDVALERLEDEWKISE